MNKKRLLLALLIGLFLLGYAQVANQLAGLSATQEIKLDSGKKLVINAGDEITIKTGTASISLKKDGTVLIKGKDLTFDFETINGKTDNNLTIKGNKIISN